MIYYLDKNNKLDEIVGKKIKYAPGNNIEFVDNLDGTITVNGTVGQNSNNNITVDDTLSSTSENPVQNKVIANELNNINTQLQANKTDILNIKTNTFSGSYNDLSDKPTIPSVGDGTITIVQNGITKGSFTTNQSGDTTIELTDNGTTYSVATQSSDGLLSASDKVKIDNMGTQATFSLSGTVLTITTK